MTLPRIFFAVPLRGRKHPEMDACLNNIEREIVRRGGVKGKTFDIYVEPRGGIALSHTLCAHAFMQSGMDKLFNIHSDVSDFFFEDIERIASSPEDVIVAAVPGRAFDDDRVTRALLAGVPIAELVRHGAPLVFWQLEQTEIDRRGFGPRSKDGHLFEIARASSGFMCLSRKAIERVARELPYAPRPTWWEDLPLQHVFSEDVAENTADARLYLMSEDTAFLTRWRNTDGIVWADTKVRLRHWGEHGFRGPALADVIKHGVYMRDTDAACEVHERASEGLAAYLAGELQARKASGRGGINVCVVCIERAKRAA